MTTIIAEYLLGSPPFVPSRSLLKSIHIIVNNIRPWDTNEQKTDISSLTATVRM